MQKTKIEWSDLTWNPVSGCTEVSPGCDNCYAKAIAERWRGGNAFPNGFDVTMRPKKLNEPKSWKKPSMVFVNSMSDLFHNEITDDFLVRIWETMLEADHHIYMILTKRVNRMKYKIRTLSLQTRRHIWLGCSVENQTLADGRIPTLVSIDTPIKFLSCEPLLGPLNLSLWLPNIQWVITGGESGRKPRRAAYDWFRGIRDQCVAADVAYLHKQGNPRGKNKDRELDGRTWNEVPFRPEEIHNG